jgi:hypothetical protein
MHSISIKVIYRVLFIRCIPWNCRMEKWTAETPELLNAEKHQVSKPLEHSMLYQSPF